MRFQVNYRRYRKNVNLSIHVTRDVPSRDAAEFAKLTDMKRGYLVAFLLPMLFGAGCVRRPPPYAVGTIPTAEQLPLMTDAQKAEGMAAYLKQNPLPARANEEKVADSALARKAIAEGTPERLANFKPRLKAAEGMAWIVKRGDGFVLVFGDDFHVDAGPSLSVFLSPTGNPTAETLQATKGVLEVGPLVATDGGQSYTLPQGIDMTKYQSIVIYNKPFRAMFAVAPIE